MKFYGAFEKVEPQDDGTIKVWGVASSESVDGEKEIVKADAMKAALPDYMEFANIREMHGKVAAGVCFEAHVDDDGKTRIGAHIVDPISVKKVQTKVLKGFSIGGGITSRDELDKTIITGVRLTEISLVDRPCNPDARIELWKAEKDASPKAGENKYGDVTFADEKNKKYPIDTEAHIRAAWNYINKAKNATKYSGGELSAIKGKIVAAWKAKIDKNGPPSAEKDLSAADLRKVDTEARAALLIENPKAQPILKSLAALAGDKLEKGLWTVSNLACLIGNLFDIQRAVETEAAYEGDGSILPDELRDSVKGLGEILQHMVAEELEELYPEGDDVDFDSMVIEMAAKVDELQKASVAVLEKAGAKHSADTMKKLQGMHDTIKGMTDNTVCGDGKEAAEKLAKAETLTKTLQETQMAVEKVSAERDEAKKSLEEAAQALEDAAKEIEKLKAEPEKSSTVLGSGLHVVTKADDAGKDEPTNVVQFVKSDGTPDEVRKAVHKALISGGKPFAPVA